MIAGPGAAASLSPNDGPWSDGVLPSPEATAETLRPATLRVDTTFDFMMGAQIIAVEGTMEADAEDAGTGDAGTEEEFRIVAVGHFARSGQCRIRIFEQPDGTSVVLATELAEYAGASVTNGAEAIATQVSLRYGLDPERTTFIEHYDDRWRGLPDSRLIGRTDGEHFDRVLFQRREREWGSELAHPLWLPATKAEVETLIGQPLS